MANKNIRNFCIIAHIDHGKSTLSDRILELTQSVDERTMSDQILDNMDIERERGITIKARAVTMHYTAKDGQTYELNLIDTPGHVDFAYEVSRSLAACEGAILVVDATQGVEAQTLANTYMALEHDLELVPVLNKIDLPSAHPDEVAQEVEDVIGLPCMDAPRISAKTGLNIDQVLERVVADIPAPTGDPDAPLKALIFDSVYDSYKGVIVYIRVFEGTVKPGDTILMMATGAKFTLVEVGHMGATSLSPCSQLSAGEVGYLTASIKTVQDTRVGDTVTLADNPTPEALPGYRQVKPMVFCGVYPADGKRYPDLKDALEKLQLNDASLTYEPENSAALGFGFRCGFLGLLHMEIITERLEREFDLDLVTTTPGVQYRITLTDGEVKTISNPSEYPDPSQIAKQEEPFVDVHLYNPQRLCGRPDGPVPAEAGRPDRHEIPRRRPGGPALCHAPGRDRLRLFRRHQEPQPRLRQLRLRVQGVPAERPGAAGLFAGRRDGGRAVHDRVPGQRLRQGPPHLRKAAGQHPPHPVRDPGAGRCGRQGDRPRDGQGPAQGRAGQVLRRRHHPQEEAAGKAEGRQKEDAPAGVGEFAQ